jgi:DNA repair protein RadA/Sms
MSKTKTHYACTNCGASYAKMIGKCYSCGSFNTVQEEVLTTFKGQKHSGRELEGQVTAIGEVPSHIQERIKAPGKELNRVLGGGLVPGSVVLLGGEPGIGKSTLLLQTALRMNAKVLYVSGEESLNQIKLRADRIGIQNENCLLLNETCVEEVAAHLKKTKPLFAIIDSIQTMFSRHLDSTPGTVAQIRESTAVLIQLAKQHDIPIILVGHITKEGQLAGPKLLEHMVDTVLQFEGETQHAYRILRTLKNRFGSAMELGIYEMSSTGMREVDNPSEVLINQRNEHLSGIAIASALEGNRPLLIETQALVSPAVYGNPQRNANGFDLKRLNMLLAILEKRAGMQLGTQDVFINIAGGLRIMDTAADLALTMAIASSFKNEASPPKLFFAGELGLSGEIRAVNRLEQRLKEAEKLGMEQAVISSYSELDSTALKIKLHRVENIRQCLALVFEQF